MHIFTYMYIYPNPRSSPGLGYTLWQTNIDPFNHHVLVESNLPTPICWEYVHLPKGIPTNIHI